MKGIIPSGDLRYDPGYRLHQGEFYLKNLLSFRFSEEKKRGAYFIVDPEGRLLYSIG